MADPKTTGSIQADVNLRSGSALPFDVMDLNAVVRARGITGTPVAVPPGRYLVTSTLPDGTSLVSPDTVEVLQDAQAKVTLQPDASSFGSMPPSATPSSQSRGWSQPAPMEKSIRFPTQILDSITVATEADE